MEYYCKRAAFKNSSSGTGLRSHVQFTNTCRNDGNEMLGNEITQNTENSRMHKIGINNGSDVTDNMYSYCSRAGDVFCTAVTSHIGCTHTYIKISHICS